MKKINNEGFSVVEGLLLLVIIGVISGAVFYVYNANKKTNESLENTGNSEVTKRDKKEEPTAKKDLTKDWYEYKSFSGSFSMKIPDGWQLVGSKGLGGMAGMCTESADCVTYHEGVRATVRQSEGGRGGPFRFILNEGETAGVGTYFERGTKAGEIKAGNVTFEKRVFTQTKAPEGPDLPKGGKEYSYLYSNGNKSIYVSYAIFSPNEKDEVQYVDAAIASLKILN